MSDDLDEKDPFGEGEVVEEENLITEGMVKKATYLIHKLAERRGADYKDILKKCKKLFAYANLAKVTLQEGHAIIDKLIELTGGEEPPTTPPQSPTKPDEPKKELEKEVEETKAKEDVVTATMRESIRAAVDITLKEVVEKEVPVQGLGGFVLEIGKVIFDAKMSEEAD